MGYPEAEQLTLTSVPWEKRWDLVWMPICGASAMQKAHVVPGARPHSPPHPQSPGWARQRKKRPQGPESPGVTSWGAGVDQVAAWATAGADFPTAPNSSLMLPGVLLWAEHLREA